MNQSSGLSDRSAASAPAMAPLSMDLLIAGLGGMGVVGLTHRLATLLRTSFPRVYTKESRGFAQRRATVTGVIRAGTQVRSPELISGIGLLIALERSEILRHLGQLRPGATVIASDACVWPSGYSGRRFQPVAMAEVEAKLHAQGVRVITLPVCRWLKDHRLPDTLSSSAALGAFVALAGFTLEDVAALVAANWNDRDRADNLRLCALGLAYAAPAVVAPQLPSAA